MKEKTRFKNHGNVSIGYRSMNGRSISDRPRKSHIGRSLIKSETLVQAYNLCTLYHWTKFMTILIGCFKVWLNTLAAGLRYIRTSISAYKTAVFGCLTNALAPPSIALESCSTAQTDRPV